MVSINEERLLHLMYLQDQGKPPDHLNQIEMYALILNITEEQVAAMLEALVEHGMADKETKETPE